jgi:diaminopropionate ammonia-lyase
MPLSYFRQPPKIVDHVANPVLTSPYPSRLEQLFPRSAADAAVAEIRQWPGYAPTPLLGLDRLAGALGLGAVLYKDESKRFGLGSFKALGGAYAVRSLVSERLGTSMADIRAGLCRDAASAITVTTATDGNHGRSVAWGAQQTGCHCRIYIHAKVSDGRAQAMAALGAEVVRIEGDYDESVRLCMRESEQNGWLMVSDTSFKGYTEVPRLVMAGYATIAVEVLTQAKHPLTHVFIPAGVGGLAAALSAQLWTELGAARPRIIVVESEHAPCLTKSARRNRPSSVRIRRETVMAGMSCGEVSLLAWEILRRSASHFVTIADSGVAPAMRMLASGKAGGGEIEAGECAVAAPLALIAAACDEKAKAAMRLDSQSQVLLIGTEGATDPDIYAKMLAGG